MGSEAAVEDEGAVAEMGAEKEGAVETAAATAVRGVTVALGAAAGSEADSVPLQLGCSNERAYTGALTVTLTCLPPRPSRCLSEK